jgi:hypothetical protein
MLNVLDEFTHECLAIRVARKLKAIDVIDVQEWIVAGGARRARTVTGSGRTGWAASANPPGACGQRPVFIFSHLGQSAASFCKGVRADLPRRRLG